MLKRLNINLALYHKPAFFIKIPRALHKHIIEAIWYIFLSAWTAPSAHCSGWLNHVQRLQTQPSVLTQQMRHSPLRGSSQSRMENLRVKVSCTQKLVALLCSFYQQVARADYKCTTIFTLLTESSSRGTCCAPTSASNTELWTETARLQIQGKLPFPLQYLYLFPWVPPSFTKQVCTCSCSQLITALPK